ncbi:unnamed protein product, partial [Meganyctiphanes norvegica]
STYWVGVTSNKVSVSRSQVQCEEKNKCSKHEGMCKEECGDGEKEISKGCIGDGCKCCISDCKPKRKCSKNGGMCKDKCGDDEKMITKGCAGDGCKCCISDCKPKKKCSKNGGMCKEE